MLNVQPILSADLLRVLARSLEEHVCCGWAQTVVFAAASSAWPRRVLTRPSRQSAAARAAHRAASAHAPPGVGRPRTGPLGQDAHSAGRSSQEGSRRGQVQHGPARPRVRGGQARAGQARAGRHEVHRAVQPRSLQSAPTAARIGARAVAPQTRTTGRPLWMSSSSL
jgi:hypothetical protein